MTDAEIVELCAKDDPRAWEKLVRHFGTKVHGTIFKTLSRSGFARRSDVADDVFQKVFQEAWEKKHFSNLPYPEMAGSILVTLAASRTLDAVRALVRHEAVELENRESEGGGVHQIASHENPRKVAEANEMRRIVAEEIKALPRKEALILRFHAMEGLTHREIAEILRIPQDTVSSVIRRAREKIRVSLESKGFKNF